MRSLVAFVLLLIGALMVPVATAGWWMRDTVVPTAAYVDTVAPLAQNPQVKTAVENRLVAELMQQIDKGGIVAQADRALAAGVLPPAVAKQLSGGAGALEPAIQRLVGRAVNVVVESPAFAQAWRSANREAHQQLVAALAGKSDAVKQDGSGQVVIRMADLSKPITKALGDAGVPFADAIPPVQGTYTVGNVQDLQRAQTAYTALERWGRWLPLLAGVLLLAGIALARSKKAAVLGAAVLSLIGIGLLAVGLVVGRSLYLDSVPSEVPQAAAKAYFDLLTSDLRRDMLWVAIASAVALVLAAVLPRSRSRSRSRRTA